MKWLSQLFNSDKKKVFIRILIKAVAVLWGKVSQDLYYTVKRNVVAVDELNITSDKKWEKAYKGIVSDLGDVDGILKYLVRIFIEAAVIELKNEKGLITF